MLKEVKITTALSCYLGYIYGEITYSKKSPTKVGKHFWKLTSLIIGANYDPQILIMAWLILS